VRLQRKDKDIREVVESQKGGELRQRKEGAECIH
jgi:hypothetical protein